MMEPAASLRRASSDRSTSAMCRPRSHWRWTSSRCEVIGKRPASVVVVRTVRGQVRLKGEGRRAQGGESTPVVQAGAVELPIPRGMYARNRREALQQFLTDGRVPSNNNISERALCRRAVRRNHAEPLITRSGSAIKVPLLMNRARGAIGPRRRASITTPHHPDGFSASIGHRAQGRARRLARGASGERRAAGPACIGGPAHESGPWHCRIRRSRWSFFLTKPLRRVGSGS